MKVFDRILEVLRTANRPLAPHEFNDIFPSLGGMVQNARRYVGCSESALGRRLREMRDEGLVGSQRRAGSSYVEYSIEFAVPIDEEAWYEAAYFSNSDVKSVGDVIGLVGVEHDFDSDYSYLNAADQLVAESWGLA